jgi:hypothetical protein
VTLGQLSFLAMMGACLAIHPSAVAIQRGLSFYGNQAETVVPFALGFAVCVAFTGLGVVCLGGGDALRRRFRLGTGTILALMALVPLTPYSVDLVLDYLHIGVTTALFSAALGFALWLAFALLRRRLAFAAVGAQAGGGLLALTAQVGWDDLMIPAQLVSQIAFSAVFVMAAARLAAQPR